MPKIKYIERKFQEKSRLMIDRVNTIIADYQDQGIEMTLRMLYYRCVIHNWIKNTEQSYDSLGALLNDARLAGLMDWDAIKDRGRSLDANNHWDSPSELIRACADQYQIDRWADQPNHVEVFIEKDALAGVFSPSCKELDVGFFACKGYVSQTAMWEAAQRFIRKIKLGKQIVVLHLGDHDPSGIDMTRDIEDRLSLFLGPQAHKLEVRRLALNMDQVQEYDLVPQPGKVTDIRFKDYQAKYGDESWELDALEPVVLTELVRENIIELRNDRKYVARSRRERVEQAQLQRVSDRWDECVELVESTIQPDEEDDE